MESESVEYKKSTSELKEAMVSIVAILNKHKKGELFFGLRNDGSCIGQHVTEATLREISQTVSANIEPKIYPKILSLTIDGKMCVKVSFTGNDTPYFAYGRAYMRVADEDRQLSVRELERLFRRKNAVKYDSAVSDCLIEDIDEATLKDFIERALKAKRIAYGYTNKADILLKLNLLREGVVTIAGKLLFSALEPIEMQTAVFAGVHKTTFIDIKQTKGNIFQLLKVAEDYVGQRINWRAKLDMRIREEIPEIPMRAISEAVVNSLCHRDYQAPESNKIAIYKDRVEIWNPGEFPDGYTPEDFIEKDLQSVLRNPLVANILYLSADIEKWGSGLRRIKDACDGEYVHVLFDSQISSFSVVFSRGGQKSGQEGGQQLNARQQKIVELIKNSPRITRKGLAIELSINQSAVQKHLHVLKVKKIIRRVGSDKSGHWEIISATA